ncbi:hypothetical protein P7K49_022754 [Saguinus oedipus]|uniref:Uncharacterized protein n=1 Tax=Saguinus oedipus TaxID=9490 RepID=A0ABQ9UJT1_SAGOE|nr:hypothetical protein P7K49_022754 [Saguinus oedipus]
MLRLRCGNPVTPEGLSRGIGEVEALVLLHRTHPGEERHPVSQSHANSQENLSSDQKENILRTARSGSTTDRLETQHGSLTPKKPGRFTAE